MTKNQPSLIVYLIIAAMLLYTGWMVQGWRKDAAIANLRKDAAQASQTAAESLAALEARNRQTEADGTTIVADITAKLTKEIAHAKQDRDRFIADVRAGRIRLSIPVVSTNGGSNACTDSGTDAGSGHETRAELAPEAASTLETIAGDGDDAIHQLNSCIDTYNRIRERFNVQAK